jgi:hypothetical protein
MTRQFAKAIFRDRRHCPLLLMQHRLTAIVSPDVSPLTRQVGDTTAVASIVAQVKNSPILSRRSAAGEAVSAAA